MAKAGERKEAVPLEEVVLAQAFELEALMNVLEPRGLITKAAVLLIVGEWGKRKFGRRGIREVRKVTQAPVAYRKCAQPIRRVRPARELGFQAEGRHLGLPRIINSAGSRFLIRISGPPFTLAGLAAIVDRVSD